MINKEFIDKYGANLIIEHNKTNIILKTDNKNIKKELLKYESKSNKRNTIHL